MYAANICQNPKDSDVFNVNDSPIMTVLIKCSTEISTSPTITFVDTEKETLKFVFLIYIQKIF